MFELVVHMVVRAARMRHPSAVSHAMYSVYKTTMGRRTFGE